jgi:hypothetical protein
MQVRRLTVLILGAVIDKLSHQDCVVSVELATTHGFLTRHECEFDLRIAPVDASHLNAVQTDNQHRGLAGLRRRSFKFVALELRVKLSADVLLDFSLSHLRTQALGYAIS